MVCRLISVVERGKKRDVGRPAMDRPVPLHQKQKQQKIKRIKMRNRMNVQLLPQTGPVPDIDFSPLYEMSHLMLCL